MKVTKIFIIHASRGRPERGLIAYNRLIGGMVSGVPYTYILSLDYDDPKLLEYKKVFSGLTDVKIIEGDNNGCVQATNRAQKFISDENLIFVNGDDLISPKGWDLELYNFIDTIPTDIFLVHLSHNIPNSGNTAIIQCISREFYNRRGYIFYPEFVSMFADTELLMAAKAMKSVYEGPPIKFEHEHPSFGFNVPWDDTYKRTNEPWKFKLGKEIIEKRAKINFGVSDA